MNVEGASGILLKRAMKFNQTPLPINKFHLNLLKQFLSETHRLKARQTDMWRVFLLLLHQAWQLYHTEGTYLLVHSVTTVALWTVIKEMHTFFILHASCTEYITIRFQHTEISVTITKFSELVIECTKKSGTI